MTQTRPTSATPSEGVRLAGSFVNRLTADVAQHGKDINALKRGSGRHGAPRMIRARLIDKQVVELPNGRDVVQYAWTPVVAKQSLSGGNTPVEVGAWEIAAGRPTSSDLGSPPYLFDSPAYNLAELALAEPVGLDFDPAGPVADLPVVSLFVWVGADGQEVRVFERSTSGSSSKNVIITAAALIGTHRWAYAVQDADIDYATGVVAGADGATPFGAYNLAELGNTAGQVNGGTDISPNEASTVTPDHVRVGAVVRVTLSGDTWTFERDIPLTVECSG